MSAHRKSLIREVLDRLDQMMAVRESRYARKQEASSEANSQGKLLRTYSSGKIHSYRTRSTYQQQVLRFVNWARACTHLPQLADLDARADELASQYLEEERAVGKSPYTLQTMRSALRLFFAQPALAAGVRLPPRYRSQITRSRRPAARDRHVQLEHWPDVVLFARATGLRKNELRLIRVGEVYPNRAGQLVALVMNGKGGKAREVPVLPTYVSPVLALVAGRPAEDRVFARLPDIDIHALRREYAQALYRLHAPDWPLLPARGRLRPTDYYRPAVRLVSRALGHERLDIVLLHYLR
jgi:integrase